MKDRQNLISCAVSNEKMTISCIVSNEGMEHVHQEWDHET